MTKRHAVDAVFSGRWFFPPGKFVFFPENAVRPFAKRKNNFWIKFTDGCISVTFQKGPKCSRLFEYTETPHMDDGETDCGRFRAVGES